MIITFQVQVDDEREYTQNQLEDMNGHMNDFVSKIEPFGYIRCEMRVNGKEFHSKLY